jgi:hypothetical protein
MSKLEEESFAKQTADEEYQSHLDRAFEKLMFIQRNFHDSIVESIFLQDAFAFFKEVFIDTYDSLVWGEHGKCKEEEVCQECHHDRASIVLTAFMVASLLRRMHLDNIKELTAKSVVGEKVQDLIMDATKALQPTMFNLKSWLELRLEVDSLYEKIKPLVEKIQNNPILNDPSMSKMN